MCPTQTYKNPKTLFILTCETACFSTGLPCKYSTLSFCSGKTWLRTANSFGTSDSRRYRQAFGPASNVYATCKENSYMG
jgi:hypothetical protein